MEKIICKIVNKSKSEDITSRVSICKNVSGYSFFYFRENDEGVLNKTESDNEIELISTRNYFSLFDKIVFYNSTTRSYLVPNKESVATAKEFIKINSQNETIVESQLSDGSICVQVIDISLLDFLKANFKEILNICTLEQINVEGLPTTKGKSVHILRDDKIFAVALSDSGKLIHSHQDEYKSIDDILFAVNHILNTHSVKKCNVIVSNPSDKELLNLLYPIYDLSSANNYAPTESISNEDNVLIVSSLCV